MPTSAWAKRCANMPPREDDRLEHFDERSTRGFGLRVLLDGCWGFYGASRLDAASVARGRRARAGKRPRRAADPVAARSRSNSFRPMRRNGSCPWASIPSPCRRARKPTCCSPSARRRATMAPTSARRRFPWRARSVSSPTASARASARPARASTRPSPPPPSTATPAAWPSRDSLTPARGAGWEYVAGAGLIEEASARGRAGARQAPREAGRHRRLRYRHRPDQSLAHDP